jgi:hypothetical protein
MRRGHEDEVPLKIENIAALVGSILAAACTSSPSGSPSISVLQQFQGGPAPLTESMVFFTHLDPPPSCVAQAGPCCQLPSSTTEYVGPARGSPVTQSGGDITVSDTSVAPAQVIGRIAFDQSPGTLPQYLVLASGSNNFPDAGWTGGDRLSFSAPSGAGGLGAFDTAITTVSFIDGIASTGVQELLLPATGDFTVHWTPDAKPQSGETMVVALNGSGGFVVCTGADAAGSLTVPSAMVSQLKPNIDNGAIQFFRTFSVPMTSPAPALRSTTSAFFVLRPQ